MLEKFKCFKMMSGFLIFFAGFAQITLAKKCKTPKFKTEPYNALFINDIPSGEYICPGVDDHPSHTECCWDGVCCPPDQNNYDILTIIAASVIVICLIFIAITLVSCFWTKGWCYHCCRVNYTYSDVAMYTQGEEEDRLNVLMPREANGTNRYDPVKIRVKPIDEL